MGIDAGENRHHGRDRLAGIVAPDFDGLQDEIPSNSIDALALFLDCDAAQHPAVIVAHESRLLAVALAHPVDQHAGLDYVVDLLVTAMLAIGIGVADDPDGGPGHLLDEGIPLHYLADILAVDFTRTAGGCIMGIDDDHADWSFPVTGQILDFICEIVRVVLAGVEPGGPAKPCERDHRRTWQAGECLV